MYFEPLRSTIIPFRAPYSQLSTTIPAALQEFANSVSGRVRVDLIGYSQARLWVRLNSPPSTGTKIRAQYLLASDGSGVFNYLDGGNGPEIDVGGMTATAASPWVNIAPVALADVILRVVTLDGDGTTSANWANFGLEVR
jgi:hypothetical protein